MLPATEEEMKFRGAGQKGSEANRKDASSR